MMKANLMLQSSCGYLDTCVLVIRGRRIYMNCRECNSNTWRHRFRCESFFTLPPFVEIIPNLFVGWMGARSLPQWGAVVSILSEEEMQYERMSGRCAGPFTGVAQPGVPLLHIDHDDRTPGLTGHFERIFNFTDKYIQEVPVFFHCRAAVSRSPFTAAVYLAARRGMKYEHALARVQRKRKVAQIWEPFIDEGREYLNHLDALKEGRVPANSYVPRGTAGWKT